MNGTVLQQNNSQSKIHPHLLALWVGIVSIMMVFGSLTSAYIVRRSAGNWLEFELPTLFGLSTILIVASSLTLHTSYWGFKTGKVNLYRWGLVLTMVIGLSFVVAQFMGWQAMNSIGATFTANPSSSFVWVISGLHAAHVLGGIGALLVALIFAFGLPYKRTKRRQTRFSLIVNYWHFVGVLWIFLYVFFQYV